MEKDEILRILETAKDECGFVPMSLVRKGFDKLPSAKAEWIPCSERFPEEGRYYVTRFDYVTNMPFLDLLWFEKGVWWDRLHPGNYAVIAWMPLPEPYLPSDEEI